MSISGISSSSFSQRPLNGTSTLYQQQLQQLGQALQSGNLSSAQSDFATLQQAFSQPSTTSGSTTGSTSGTTSSPVNQAFTQLASDLQSGNLSATQKDFPAVQQDLKGYASPPTNIFHHRSAPFSAGGPATGGVGSNPTNQNLNQLAQGLPSSTPAGAQQAYATLQQQFQQFALGSEDSEEMSNLPVSLVA
jgi:hypothetical protein